MDNAFIDHLEIAISKIVSSRFVDAELHSVHVVPDWDADGDPILRVKIVLNTANAFDAAKAKGLTQQIFPVLTDEAKGLFPILSFLSKSDYARMSEAA